MSNLQQKTRTCGGLVLLPLLSLVGMTAAGVGCGRMVIGHLPAGGRPDGSSDLPTDAGGDTAGDTAVDSTGDATVGVPNLPQVCTSDGWCWTHPLPSSDRFVAAYQVAPDDLWFIGANGTIVRYAGGNWSALPSPTNRLSAIWASGSDNVWVGGPAGPFHWDGGAWMLVPPPTSPEARAVNGIWGCGPDDVWVMGTVATHWHAGQLTFVPMQIEAGGFRAVWGTACNDVWAGFVDDSLGSGRVLHFDGTSWTTTANRPAEQLIGTGTDDVWSQAQGQLFQWSGLAAGTQRDGRTLDLFSAGNAAIGTLNDARAVSLFARGGGMSTLPALAPDAVMSLWGRASDDIWGFGARGVATHWQGSSWTAQLPGWAISAGAASKITGSGPTDLWAVVGGDLLHGDGTTWRTALAARAAGGGIYDVWAPSADEAWALGFDDVIHRWIAPGSSAGADAGGGAGWTIVDPPPRGATTPEMRAISGTGPNDVWVLRGRNSVLQWNGMTWVSRQPLIDHLTDVWSSAPNEVWVVGDSVSRWSGTGWSPPRLPGAIGSTPFSAVGGTGPTDVWFLAGGYALQLAPNAWDVSVVLNTGWRGAALTPGGLGGGVWALFQDGTTASRTYRLTAAAPSGTGTTPVIGPAGLNDLWAAPDGTLWSAGGDAALLRRRPTP
jgi:hypothetical protein